MTSAHEPATGEVFLTPVQARRRIGVSHRTFQRYRADGRIRPSHYTPSGHARFRPADVDALVESGAAAAAPVPAEAGAANPAFLLVPVAVVIGLFLPYSFGTSVGVLVAAIGVVAGLGVRVARGRRDRVVDVERRAAAVAHRRILGGAR